MLVLQQTWFDFWNDFRPHCILVKYTSAIFFVMVKSWPVKFYHTVERNCKENFHLTFDDINTVTDTCNMLHLNDT